MTALSRAVAVTLVANYRHDEQASMQRYAGMLEQQLAEHGFRVTVLRPEPHFGRLWPAGEGIGKWLGYLDKFLIFPFVLRRHVRGQKTPFLVHICDHSNAMYTTWLRDVPHLVTCHDVMAIQSARGLIPGQSTRWTGRVLQSWILSGLRQAARVVCVSEETRQELLALAPELEPRTTTVENGLPHPYGPLAAEEAWRQLALLGLKEKFPPGGGRFLFHVGGNQWYKNREGVIRIFAQLCVQDPDWVDWRQLKLVMAGKPPTDALRQLVASEGLEDKVFFVGTVSEDQLRACYSMAEALIFPSLREGFGWPLIEAQACGCPVMTSNRAPMERLAGPAGGVADPEDAADFAARLRQLLGEEPERRRERRLEAQVQARRYGAELFFERMLELYELASKRLDLRTEDGDK